MNITCALENFLAFRDKDTGELLAVEQINGHVKRHDTTPTNNARSLELFGAEKISTRLSTDEDSSKK